MSKEFEIRNLFVSQVQAYHTKYPTVEVRFMLEKDGEKKKKKINFPWIE